jgi:2-keto-3-deoxy-L-rhamnonate aldolase RhmA
MGGRLAIAQIGACNPESLMRANRIKDKIARGLPALGCSMMFSSPQIVEILGYAGFDWVLLDCEHGSIGPSDLELMAIACDAAGVTPIARPRTNAACDIQSVMDRGVMGVQVPQVNTAEDARRAVAAVKFGPGSARGLAAATRPDRWGLGARLPDYIAAANRASLVCVQLEHASALANIDAILEVAGIDVAFIGPSDLSQSLGYPGEPKAPAVVAAIAAAVTKIRAAGLTPGMPASPESLAEVTGMGCRYVYTHLPRLIGAGAAGFLGKA